MPVRLPSFLLPFTEPSAEVDVVAVNGKWLEVLGCGWCIRTCCVTLAINRKIYSGFALGWE
ncbi:hypothetical protein ACLK19_11600 [Escherichia coli]